MIEAVRYMYMLNDDKRTKKTAYNRLHAVFYMILTFHLDKTQKKEYPFGYPLAWRRPTLTGAKPQLPSALRSLTSVFGMGTGVTFSLSSPNYLV